MPLNSRIDLKENYCLFMKEGIKRLFSLTLIILLLFKGLYSLLPSVSYILDDTVTEFQLEPEQEKHKAGSRLAETEPVEEFFERTQFAHEDIYAFFASDRHIIYIAHSLPWVHLDILTPPPDLV
jgi:hypothetical protein